MDTRAIAALLGGGPSCWGITVKSEDRVLLWNMHKDSGPLDISVEDGLQRRAPVLHTNMEAWRRIQDDVTARHWLEVAQAAAADKVPGLSVRWHAGLTCSHDLSDLASGSWVRFGGPTELRLAMLHGLEKAGCKAFLGQAPPDGIERVLQDNLR